MKTPFYLPRLLCLALALAWTQGVQASTVFWNSTFNDALFDSAGNPLDSSYSFEIGTFGDSFTSFIPSYGNVDQWAANWHVIDRAYDSDPNGWNWPEQFFTGTVGFDANNVSDSADADPAFQFTQGKVVYLWAYNSKNIVPGSEWALVTDGSSVGDQSPDDWIIPDPADAVGSYNWQLTDANSAIIGGANGAQGPGEYSTTPPLFSLQTAVVPEPASALLLFAAAAAHLTRRFRRTTRTFLS
jgi:hypothetical protein